MAAMNKNQILAITFSISMCFISNISFSQKKASVPKFTELESKARSLFFYEKYKDAAPLYVKLDSINPDHTKYDYALGVCYLNSNELEKAENHFQSALKRKDTPIQVYYYLGKTEHLAHNFQKAIDYFLIYKDTLNHLLNNPGSKPPVDLDMHQHNKKTVKEIEQQVDMCLRGIEYLGEPAKMKVTNAGNVLNSKYPEYTPVFTHNVDFMFINSRRPESMGIKNEDEEDYTEDIFVSYKTGETWTKPANIADQLNKSFNSDNHDAVASLSHDGENLIVYRSAAGKYSSGDLFLCKLNEDVWTDPKEFPEIINSKYSETHACLTPDNNGLFFVSDRPGGKGKRDIYFIKKDASGAWENSIYGLDSINTSEEEESPWISPDGKKLYFSSKGHSTMGGFDNFVSIFDSTSNKWKSPINLGYPLNSARDDIYLMWSLDGNTGYFTSWREDTYGDKDTYKVTKEFPEPAQFALKGRVLESGTQLPVSATLTLSDPLTQKLIVKLQTDPKTGKYSTIVPAKNFDVDVTSKNHIFFEDTVLIPVTHAYNERIKDFYLEEILVAHKAILKNIFFDYAQSTLRPESEKELVKLYSLLKENESLKLEISGHTDSIANHDYNMNLSKERAEAVVNYLLTHGIDASRLTAVGYGETQPIASNGTDQGRQLNRRTEFLITDIKTDHKLTSINDSLLAVKGMHSNDKNFIAKINPIALFDKKPISGQFLPGDVHFPFNEGKLITDFSKRKLDKVIDMLYDYPEIKLQLKGFADATELNTNANITDQRIKTVTDYLLEKGITSNRISKGESTKKSSSKNADSDVKNRRVEFLVL